MKIEKGIPIPPNRGKNIDYEWMRNLKVGDSFVVESRYMASNHMTWGLRNMKGWEFVSKKTDSPIGIRVWRVK